MTSNICRVSSISCLLLPPAAQTNHPVGSAYSRLPWLAAPPPPYRTYPPTLASASLYSPTRPVILRRRQPQHAPAPEPVTLVLASACDWTGASSAAPIRSVRGLAVVLRLAALVRSPCAVRRPLALSTSSTTERNKEMTVRGEDDSRDPPASWQYASKCLYSTSPKIWFLLMVGHLGLTPLST